MTSVRYLFLAPVLLLAPSTLMACEPQSLSYESHIRGAKVVAVGYVTGERFPEFESSVLHLGPGKKLRYSQPARDVRLAAVEVLIGQVDGPIYVKVPCDAPFPNTYAKVVFGISSDGWQWVFPAKTHEERLKALIEGKI